ncbi:hypothetical protein GGH17_005709, partial [Coemansia sp. RSA 788]
CTRTLCVISIWHCCSLAVRLRLLACSVCLRRWSRLCYKTVIGCLTASGCSCKEMLDKLTWSMTSMQKDCQRRRVCPSPSCLLMLGESVLYR